MYSGMAQMYFMHDPIHLGHCGFFGLGGVILSISVGVMLFAANEGVLIMSLNTGAPALKALTTVYTWNMMGPVMWLSALIVGIVGVASILTPNPKVRLPLINVFLFLLMAHFVIVVVYGCMMCDAFRQMYLIHKELWVAFSSAVGSKLEEKIGSKTIKGDITEGSTLFEAFEQASAGVIFAVAPYPLNFIFFLGLRIDLAAFLFVIFPGVFILFSIPFVFSIRSYLASEKEGVVKHRKAYKDTALVRYMCNGPPTDDPVDYDDPDHLLGEEEDLASTFDGDYSGKEYDDEDDDEDIEDDLESEINNPRVVPAPVVAVIKPPKQRQ